MYEEYFQLKTTPFSLTPSIQFFCKLDGHQKAFSTLLFCIKSGEGFVKIIGEVGSGKTLLCRKLLENLKEENITTAYIPNPDLSPIELRKAVARELGLDPIQSQDQHELLTAIYHHLASLHIAGKKVVIVIDEAQALSDESLETVRLLTNFETENTKLLQVVLFGQPELDERLNKPHLRQLKQRITFSYRLPLMSRQELDIYLMHRLATAGFTHGHLFTLKARQLLYRASQGVPRLVNILCHKACLVAYGRGEAQVSHHAVKSAIRDTESIALTRKPLFISMGLGMMTVLLLMIFLLFLLGTF